MCESVKGCWEAWWALVMLKLIMSVYSHSCCFTIRRYYVLSAGTDSRKCLWKEVNSKILSETKRWDESAWWRHHARTHAVAMSDDGMAGADSKRFLSVIALSIGKPDSLSSAAVDEDNVVVNTSWSLQIIWRPCRYNNYLSALLDLQLMPSHTHGIHPSIHLLQNRGMWTVNSPKWNKHESQDRKCSWLQPRHRVIWLDSVHALPSMQRQFLANVNLRSRSLYAIAVPSVVCNVRAPYSNGRNFRQLFFAVWYLGHPLTFTENFTEIVPREPLRRGL